MKQQNSDVRLYNLLFPFWMLMFLPVPPLILLTLLGNLLIDSLVLLITMRAMKLPARREIFRKAWWRVWRNGFLADLIGAAWLVIGYLTASLLPGHLFPGDLNDVPWLYDFTLALNFNVFQNPLAFIWTAIGVVISGICIYFFNRRTLTRRTDLDESQIRRIYLVLAIATAPWTFFIPVGSS